MNQLAVINENLTILIPEFTKAIAPELRRKVPAERIVKTLMVSLEKNPALANCSMQSLVNAAWSAACLALEIDGVTGQGFLLPFNGQAQLVIGYKGYNTLAARSGYSISASVVRKGDKFEFSKGSDGFVRHSYSLDAARGDIIGAWAIAESKTLPTIVEVLTIAELMQTKAKSPGAKKSSSPWNIPDIGFPAMCEKTARRRLARSMPLNVMQLAAALDQHGEAGEYCFIDPDDKTLKLGKTPEVPADIEEPDLGDVLNTSPISYNIISLQGEVRTTTDKGQWIAAISSILKKATQKQVDEFALRHQEHLSTLEKSDPDAAQTVRDLITDAVTSFHQ